MILGASFILVFHRFLQSFFLTWFLSLPYRFLVHIAVALIDAVITIRPCSKREQTISRVASLIPSHEVHLAQTWQPWTKHRYRYRTLISDLFGLAYAGHGVSAGGQRTSHLIFRFAHWPPICPALNPHVRDRRPCTFRWPRHGLSESGRDKRAYWDTSVW